MMRSRTLLFIAAIFCFSISANAQVNLDSLFAIWNDTTQPDTARLKAIQTISFGSYRLSNPDSSLYFAQLQYDLAAAAGHKKWMAKALTTQGLNHLDKGDPDTALDYLSRSIKMDEEIGNKLSIAGSLMGVGHCYTRKGDHAKALEYYFQSLKISEEIGYREPLAGTLKSIGDIYRVQGDFDQALVFLNRSNKNFKEIGDVGGQTGVQNTIAAIYSNQGDYPEALEIYAQNLAVYKKMGDNVNAAGMQANIGSIYLKQGDYAKALENCMVSLKGFEEMGIVRGVAGVSMLIGEIYFEQGNYALALEYNTKSLTISEKTGNKANMAGAQGKIAKIYNKQGNYTKAISIGTEALKLSQEIGAMQLIQSIVWDLSTSYKATGRYQKALEMTELYYQTRDSIKSEENQKAVIQQQVQSDYEKQKAIDDLENGKRVAIETQKKKNQQKLSLAIGGILLLALLLALGLWNRNRYIKKTSAALATAKDRAEQSEKYKEQFLANMSHEIRTPMHAISGMVNILKRNEHLPSQDAYLDAMHTSSDNLVVILNDVLDLSKIEAGKLDIEKNPMNPTAVIENVAQILKYKAEEKGLQLNYKVEDDVPPLVMGDATRLNQILINLAGNAIKFTEKGSVDILLKKENDSLRYIIKDTGIGIPKDKMENIFEAFEQVKGSTSRQYRGTGLGLSISKQLVELQNGKIWAQSEVGQGSIFYVELPLMAAAADAIGKDLITGEKLKTMAASLKGVRILLAEDNAFNQMIAQDDLSFYFEDVKIDTVENGALAVEKFKTGNYDLILMDVQMPEMNGFEAAKKIREIEQSTGKEKRIPIIAMTASLLKSEIENCLAAGMDNYIPKPYKPEELIGTIFNGLKG